MPNYCDYCMKIIGKKSDCREFLYRLKSYNAPNHFYRIFEADDYDAYTDENGVTSMYISGYCAWSLESCCRASGYSNGIDLFEVNTREFHLKMEVFSRETGIDFEEHYIYSNGECVKDECLDISVYYWDRNEFPTYEEFKEEYPEAPPPEVFEADDEVIVGGFGDDWAEWTI